MEKYHKVLIPIGGKMLSNVVYDTEFAVEYKEGEWVYPSVGKLFVFRKYSEAFEFYWTRTANQTPALLWECEVKNPIFNAKSILRAAVVASNPGKVYEFWTPDEEEHNVFESRGWDAVRSPAINTVLVDAVKLTKDKTELAQMDWHTRIENLLRAKEEIRFDVW